MRTPTKPIPRFVPNAGKAVEAILCIVNARRGLDVYHVVKAAFFADKFHIANYGRPIVGDEYRAAAYGPLPQVIYGLLRRDPIEMLAFGGNGELPFGVDRSLMVIPSRQPNLRRLSESDVEALEHGAAHVAGRSFDDLYRESHDDPAYLRAEAGAAMDYREFIPDGDPDKKEKADYISEEAESAVI